MSPVSTATRDPSVVRPVPVLPFPTADLRIDWAKEIVVDWQLPSDTERTN